MKIVLYWIVVESIIIANYFNYDHWIYHGYYKVFVLFDWSTILSDVQIVVPKMLAANTLYMNWWEIQGDKIICTGNLVTTKCLFSRQTIATIGCLEVLLNNAPNRGVSGGGTY